MQEALLHLKASDPILGRIIDAIGAYGIEFREPNFETLVKAIVYQQLSGKVASIIFGRLVAAANGGPKPARGRAGAGGRAVVAAANDGVAPKGGRAGVGSEAAVAAPNGGPGAFAVAECGLTPEGVLKLRTQKMRALGLSQQKITYIRELARCARSGALDLSAMAALPDDEVYRRLISLKGIGVWTVQMFLMFALRRQDVLPAGDLGIRAAVRKLYGFDEMPTPAQVEELALKWKPYCTVASWYLWRSLEPNASL